MALPDHYIQRREQGGGAVMFVVVAHHMPDNGVDRLVRFAFCKRDNTA